MKSKKVCKNCKCHIVRLSNTNLIGTCKYFFETGQSRLVVEMANGGYKKDSCVCYARRCE